MRAPQTVVWLEKYGPEIESLIGDVPVPPKNVATTPDIEDPIAFAMEKHLEEFLVSNWAQTELARDVQIDEEDGETVDQQYQTDTGPLDILAVSHDRKRLLVVDLKRGRASDVVMGRCCDTWVRAVGVCRRRPGSRGSHRGAKTIRSARVPCSSCRRSDSAATKSASGLSGAEMDEIGNAERVT
ncbi:MAG: hypothetical protein AAFO89_13965 [Planctomycetota bacterium]